MLASLPGKNSSVKMMQQMQHSRQSSTQSSTPSSSKASTSTLSPSSTSSRTRTTSPSLLAGLGLTTALLALAATTAPLSVNAQAHNSALALHEPPDGSVLFGAWVQTDEGNTPSHFNENLGFNASVIQIAQDIPLSPYNYVTGAGGGAPEYLIERTGTNAGVYLTVYPNQGFDLVTDDDLTALGNQILNWTENFNRTVWLRWAPEFNGNWNIYGLQPLAFVQTWIRMHGIIKAIAPQTALVWAPNTGQGYPYSMSLPANATEAAALDTNNDGRLSALDSPFSAYWPGSQYVDWSGLSVYYKGPNSQNLNVLQPIGYCYGAMVNYNPNTGTNAADPWYETYCDAQDGVACMFAESGSAYHDMISGDQGVPHFDLQQRWWQDCLTNVSMFTEFPKLKLMMQFEYEKNETDSGVNDHRDYRLTNDTQIAAGFSADLAAMTSEVYSWATFRPIPTSTPNVVTNTAIYTTTDSNGALVTETSRQVTSTFSFMTVRVTNTNFPTLFGEYYSGSTRTIITSAVVLFASSMAVMLGGTIFLMRV